MSTQDICYERLVNLHQPGGESTLFDSNKITLKFTKGSQFTDRSYLEGIISNLNLSSEAVLDPFCVEEGCVVGGGIWTTAITSDISRNNDGVIEYWIAGSLDSEGNVWVLDLGIISSTTGDFLIKDKSVPINNSGYFKSRISLPEGIKLAVLRKVSYNQAISVLHSFGEYRNNRRITRAKVGYLLEYNAEDQQSDLELLSQGLINLIFSTYKSIEANTVKYFTKGELDFYIKKIIEDNISAIADLVDFKSTSRRLNSIPKTLTTYLTPDLLYEDKFYLDNIARCVEQECVEDECLVNKPVYITSSREVSTRAIAWFYLLIYTYSLYLDNSQYVYFLDLLAFYLINQINTTNNLPTKGWTHTDVLTESEEIIEYNLSTAVVVYIALLKHYDYTVNSSYLETTTNLEEAIWSTFYNFKKKEFNTSSIEDISYGLLFSNLVNRADVVESLITKIESNLTINYGVVKESLDGVNIINLNKLSQDYLENNPTSLNFTTLTNPYTSLLDISNNNLLLVYSLQLSQLNQYYLSLKLQNYITTFLDTLNEVESTNTFVYVCSCLSDPSLYNLEVIQKGDYYLTSNLSFERSLVLNKLLDLPTDYGWFSKKALQFTGNVYKLLKSIGNSLSTFSVFSKDIISNNYLNSLKGFRLLNYIKSLGFFRLPQELDSELFSYISSVLGGKEDSITLVGLSKKINRFNVANSNSEPYNQILKLNSTKNQTLLGNNYYIGNNYASTNIAEVTALQPINTVIESETKKSLPISTKGFLNEVITLENFIVESTNCLEENINENFYLLLDATINSSTILGEIGDTTLQETDLVIFTEDTGTVNTDLSNLLLEDNNELLTE